MKVGYAIVFVSDMTGAVAFDQSVGEERRGR